MAGTGGPAPLTKLLASLDVDALSALLSVRPDAAAAPEPRTLGELAQRLDSDRSVHRAVGGLPLPALELAEVLQALGDGCTRTDLDDLLGVGVHVDREQLDGLLHELSTLALVWRQRELLRIPAALARFTDHPLGLGEPAQQLLAALTVDQLSRIGGYHGLTGQRRKTDWVAELVTSLGNPKRVSAALDGAPPGTAELADRLAWVSPRAHAPVRFVTEGMAPYGLRLPAELTWLVQRGLVLPTGWDGGQMPSEVALAVRGPDYYPQLRTELPVLHTVDAPTDPTPAAAAALVDTVAALLATLSHAPAQQLAAGGVGVRELRRLAKQLGSTETQVRLALELAAAAGLARAVPDGVLPTHAADRWLDADPGTRLAGLLTAWRRLGPVPTHHLNADGKALPALDGGYPHPGPTLRTDLLWLLAEQAPGTAVADLAELAHLLAWRYPLRYRTAETLDPYLRATCTEAGALGLVVDGALSALGRAAASDAPDDELAAIAATALPAPADRATFLPDLTAVVSGPPSAGLAGLLDEVADLENRDAASTWRLSPASVRRALDAGHTADGLLTKLAEVADRALPQPVEYLFRDAARRHGQLRVVPSACCLCTDDSALANELAHHRALGKLGLRQLSQTVLASSEPVEPTLRALRSAGYSPVRHSASGQTVIERTEAHRAPDLPGPRRAGPRPDPAGLARRLAGGATVPARSPSETERRVADGVDQLDRAQVRLLAHAIEQRTPVRIGYVSSSGGRTERVIEPIALFFDALQAWCRLREDERVFRLDRVQAVSPV